MGPRVMRRLPKFVHGFIDRHGRPRFYFRRPDLSRGRRKACPTGQFMTAYEDALAGQMVPVGAARTRPGT